MEHRIDVTLDFTLDSPGYWEGYWGIDDYVPQIKVDPDTSSTALCEHHRLLWSKPLPNGDTLKLSHYRYGGKNYLKWSDFIFASDALICSYAYHCQKELLVKLHPDAKDHRNFLENFQHNAYRNGGHIIWPCHTQSINQCRGTNKIIRDRFDRTIECIRRYYLDFESPLTKCLVKDKQFFDLFVDFKGFIDFFHLQDVVTPDYSKVNIWLGDNAFSTRPLPQTTEEYWQFQENQLRFLELRSQRIAGWAADNGF